MTPVTRNAAFRTRAEVLALVEAFETARLPRESWDHRAHLCVALWYLHHHPEQEATRRMICGIQRYNHAQGIRRTPTGGYHETLTVFWLAAVRTFLRAQPRSAGVLDLANALIDGLGQRRALPLEFYSEARLWSREARWHWVEPDLKPLSELTV